MHNYFKDKMETWKGKLVRLKRECSTGAYIFKKGTLMRVSSVNNVKVTLITLPCEACGVQASMTIKDKKTNYKSFFDFVEEKE
ncbi:hypothetical protein [Campylobacter upsaliensis]|uniref:hypothetical protein n=1 Tax=Campylobacter upsaliensis TaxID=28080 RepID=UPI00214A63F0|nr:hypothetical protein [Campylobacter upsaliensis]MCR2110885.1 hypothetical protein [Campylobacter upsaliensis]